jgi:hypothetical protein
MLSKISLLTLWVKRFFLSDYEINQIYSFPEKQQAQKISPSVIPVNSFDSKKPMMKTVF